MLSSFRRVEKALISVGASELQSIIDDGKPIEITCQFCGKTYRFSVAEIEELLKKAR